MLRISIGGVTIFGAPTDSPSRVEGLFVARDGFDGWEDGGGESRREAIPRPDAHGEFDLPVLQGSRVITIDGHALAESDQKLIHLRNLVMGVCADGRAARLTVEHRGQTLWADVRRGQKPTFKDKGIRYGRRHGTFVLQVVAADPRKYGEVREYAAGEAAVHYGNFPARPKIIVSGVAEAGYTVTGPGGRRVVVTTPLVSGQPHTLDFVKGGLWVNGVRRLRAISIYEPWEIPPGLPGVVAAVNGSRTLRVQVSDTFV